MMGQDECLSGTERKSTCDSKVECDLGDVTRSGGGGKGNTQRDDVPLPRPCKYISRTSHITRTRPSR